jgi:thymidylate kinase
VPAWLAAGGVVICDRWLLAQILHERGRQLDPAIVPPVLTPPPRLWPSVVILLDVDPHVARPGRQLRGWL